MTSPNSPALPCSARLASHTIVPQAPASHCCKRQHSCQEPQGTTAAPPPPRALGAADLLSLGWPTGAMDFLTEEDLELLEPAPDIHALFVHYNELYFESRLGACSGALRCMCCFTVAVGVEWSSSHVSSRVPSTANCPDRTLSDMPCSSVRQYGAWHGGNCKLPTCAQSQPAAAHPHVAVEWSSARMTVCGGTCELIGGGAGGARIKLSEPLLKVGNSTACGMCVGGCCSKERHSCCAHSVPPTAPACHLGRQAAPARQALGMTRCTAAPPLPAPAVAAHAGPQGRAAARNDARGERRI